MKLAALLGLIAYCAFCWALIPPAVNALLGPAP